MEELGVDDETVKQHEAEAEQERRRRKKKKPAALARQRSESEVLEDLGLNGSSAVFRVVGVIFAVVLFMASVGGIMNLISSSNNKALASQVEAQKNLNVNVAREVFLLACETTWQASKLWGRLLVAVLLPTSHTTFRITKDGFSAMQPSLQASYLFMAHLHWTTKLALAGASAALASAWLLQREIRRRKYVERLQAWQAQRAASVSRAYESLAVRVRKQSRVLGDLLPHVLFAGAAAAGYAVGKDQFAEFSRGLGGWAVVIGFPVVMATRALIVYDMAYRAKIEQIYGRRRRRTFSELPTAESAARATSNGGLGATLSSWLPAFMRGGDSNKRRSVRAGNSRMSAQRMRRSVGRGAAAEESEDDASSIGSLDSAEVVTTFEGLHYPRQLEDDPVASLEQYKELQSVVYWVQYWTVLGVALLFEQLPVSGHLLAALPSWPPARVLWALWLQVPGTSGARLSFMLVVPLVDRLLGRVEGPGVSAEQQNLLVNVLFAFRIISGETRAKLAEVLETGGTLLALGFVFFVMPSTITGMGALGIGIGRPIVAASRALLAIDRAERVTRAAASPKADSAVRKRFRSNSVSISHGAVQTTQWLEYWVVYTVSMLGHGLLSMFLFWFPLWNHMLLAYTLWLQLPYFRGAHNIFKVALQVFYRVRAVFVADKRAPAAAEGEPEAPRALSPVEEAEEAVAVAAERRASKSRSRKSSAAPARESKERKSLRKQARRAQQEEAARAAQAAQQTTWLGWVFGGASGGKAVEAVPEQFADDFGGEDDNSSSSGAGAEQEAGDAQRRDSREAFLGGGGSDDDEAEELAPRDDADSVAEEEALLAAALLEVRDESAALDEAELADARDSVDSGDARRSRRRVSRKHPKLNSKLISTGGSSSSLAAAARAKTEADEAAAAAAAAAEPPSSPGLFASWFGSK